MTARTSRRERQRAAAVAVLRAYQAFLDSDDLDPLRDSLTVLAEVFDIEIEPVA